jgi:hypothetical protein
MPEITDPTFYRTPGDAVTAAPESLAYVAAFDPRGIANDAIAVLDCDSTSGTYGKLVGWAELPLAATSYTTSGGMRALARYATAATPEASSAAI